MTIFAINSHIIQTLSTENKKTRETTTIKQNLRLRSQEPVTLRGDVILDDRMLLAPVAEAKQFQKSIKQNTNLRQSNAYL